MIEACVFLLAVVTLSGVRASGRQRSIQVADGRTRWAWGGALDALRSRRHRPTDWAASLGEVARCVRGGDTLMTAIADQPPLQRAARRWRIGEAASDALRPSADAGADERLAFAVLRSVAELGGSGALAIDRAADTIRERQHLRAERRAQAAQARASAWVLSAVGPLFALWTVSTDPRVRGFLFGSPAGAACVAAGLALNAIGWFWMRRIVEVRG